MKKRFSIKLIIFLTLILLLINGCTNTSSPASTPTQTPSATLPPTLTVTPSPTLTPTPVPVTIEEAIQRGTFAELEVFNKGQIAYSAFSPDGLQFVAITKRGMYAYNVESWQELFFAPLSPEVFVTSINYSVDGSLFALGDSSGMITFWDTKTWGVQNSFQVHESAITSLDISPDNMNFVTTGAEKEISLWNMNDGSLVKSQVRNGDVGLAYYSLDGKWLYTSESKQGLVVWSSENLTLTNRLSRLSSFGGRSSHQAVSPYTNIVATYVFGVITIHDFDKEETTEVKLDQWEVYSAQMTFWDEKTLMLKFLGDDDYYLIDLVSYTFNNLSLESLSKKTFKNPEFLHILKRDEIKALGFEPLGGIQRITSDGTGLILSGRDETPSGIFDLNQKTMKKIATIQEFPWASSTFLSDGSLAGVDWVRPIRNPPFANKEQQGDFNITILDSSFLLKETIKQAYDFPDYIDIAKVSPNGEILAVGTADGNLYLWNLDTKEVIATIRPHNKNIGAFGFYGAYWRLFFDDDGSHLITFGQDGKIKVISMEDLSEIASVNGENPAFSPDGSNLAYISSDGSIRLVSLFDEYEPKIFRGDINTVNSISFSPDGTLLFSGDYNDDWDNPDRQSKLKVWSISDATLLLDLPQYNIVSFLVSPDGTRLYVHDGDGVISVWGHDPEKE